MDSWAKVIQKWMELSLQRMQACEPASEQQSADDENPKEDVYLDEIVEQLLYDQKWIQRALQKEQASEPASDEQAKNETEPPEQDVQDITEYVHQFLQKQQWMNHALQEPSREALQNETMEVGLQKEEVPAFNENVKQLLHQRDKLQFDAMRDGIVLNDIARKEAGTLKTMINLNFFRVLQRRVMNTMVSRYQFGVRKFVLASFSKLVTSFILGRKGIPVKFSEDDDDEDSNDSEQQDIYDGDNEIADNNMESLSNFRNCLRRRMNGLSKRSKLLGREKALFKFLMSKDIDQLRTEYLPPYLKEFVHEWKRKLTENGYSRIPLVWRLFGEVNNVEFTQQLYPQPTVQAKMVNLTTTRLAFMWTSFIKYHHKSDPGINKFVKDHMAAFGSTLSKSETDLKTPVDKNWGGVFGKYGLYTTAQKWTERPHLLWSLLFPALFDPAKQQGMKHLKFLYFGQTNGYQFNGLFAKTNTWTSKNHASGYNSRSWRSHFPENESVFDIASLLCKIARTKDGLPGHKADTSPKLLLPIDSMLEDGLLETGKEASDKLFHAQIIHIHDFGNVNTSGMISALVVYDKEADKMHVYFARHLIRSRGYYANSGIDRHIEIRQGDMAEYAAEIQALGEEHARKMDVEEYQKYADNFRRNGTKIWEANNTEEVLHKQLKLRRDKQRHWDNVRNEMLANADALVAHYQKVQKEQNLPERDFSVVSAPLVIVGNGSFGATKGNRSGCPIWLRNYFSRHYVTIMVDEYNSSQKCPKCHGQTEFYEGYRVKECKNPNCVHDKHERFLMNRDISAPMNMLYIVAHMIRFGERPQVFSPNSNN